MKPLVAVITLALGCALSRGAESSATTTVTRDAEKCAAAVLASDYDAIVRYTHKRVVSALGGKDAMIAILKKSFADLSARGVEIETATIGIAEEPTKVGTWLLSRVPERIVMKISGGRLQTDSHLLGISEDDGTSWLFVDLGPITKDQFAQLFPELDGKVTIPEKSKPVFQKD